MMKVYITPNPILITRAPTLPGRRLVVLEGLCRCCRVTRIFRVVLPALRQLDKRIPLGFCRDLLGV